MSYHFHETSRELAPPYISGARPSTLEKHATTRTRACKGVGFWSIFTRHLSPGRKDTTARTSACKGSLCSCLVHRDISGACPFPHDTNECLQRFIFPIMFTRHLGSSPLPTSQELAPPDISGARPSTLEKHATTRTRACKGVGFWSIFTRHLSPGREDTTARTSVCKGFIVFLSCSPRHLGSLPLPSRHERVLAKVHISYHVHETSRELAPPDISGACPSRHLRSSPLHP